MGDQGSGGSGDAGRRNLGEGNEDMENLRLEVNREQVESVGERLVTTYY
ncbi:MAG: hypothetical protein GTO03_08795 [Planctomycetales bacterium]|nr:hypothetical protein [Planctomycetales bacterium]